MSFSLDRNPSPPREILDEDENFVPDRIGSTVYSKRWLYKTLMNMIKIVQDYSGSDNPNEDISLSTEERDQIIYELDPKIEEDACTLWDMSANLEVAEFLRESHVADSFLFMIEQTKSPRLLEIVVGILGNMSSFSSTCEYISKNKPLVSAIIMLSGCSDSCTLVQLFRLLTCGIVKENCKAEWFQTFQENEYFMENLKVILENNLCRDVLCRLLEFLDSILNYCPSYCSLWSEQPYTSALIECGKQLLKCNHNEDLDIFFTVVNSLCQQSSNIAVYGAWFGDLRPIFHTYFSKVGEEEYLPQVSRATAVSSTFALYGNLLFSGSVVADYIVFDENTFKAMLNICKLVKNQLSNLKRYRENDDSSKEQSTNAVNSVMMEERNGESSDEESIVQSWQTLLEAVIHAAKACVSFTTQENELKILEDIIKFEDLGLEQMDL